MKAVAEYRRYLNWLRDMQALELEGVWPQGTRHLYSNPQTAVHNRGIAQALCRAMTRR